MNCSITRYQQKSVAQQEQIDINSELKKFMSLPGFEPGLPQQNAIALPLAPPPLRAREFALKQPVLLELIDLASMLLETFNSES